MNEDRGRGTPGDQPGRSAEADLHAGIGAGATENSEDRMAKARREAGDFAADMAEGARDKAEELAEKGKTAGANRMQGFARAARRAADDIAQESPEVARTMRQAAAGLDRAAASVKDRSVGEIVDMVEDFARRQPTAYFGSTVLAGFLLSRFMKSRPARPGRQNGEPRSAERSAPRRDTAARPDDGAPYTASDEQSFMPSSTEEMR